MLQALTNDYYCQHSIIIMSSHDSFLHYVFRYTDLQDTSNTILSVQMAENNELERKVRSMSESQLIKLLEASWEGYGFILDEKQQNVLRMVLDCVLRLEEGRNTHNIDLLVAAFPHAGWLGDVSLAVRMLELLPKSGQRLVMEVNGNTSNRYDILDLLKVMCINHSMNVLKTLLQMAYH